MPDLNNLKDLIDQEVVLDTAGPVVYLGILREVTPDGFWLETADLRDSIEGHVTKERYLCEARARGIHPNRQRIYVFSHAVISISALADVLAE